MAATATLLVMLVGLSVTSVSAAPSLASAMSSEGYEATKEWCADHGTASECTRVEAVVVATTNPDGGRTVRVSVRQVVSADADGVEAAPAVATSYERTVFAPSSDGLSFRVGLAADGDAGGSCVSTYRLDVVRYELLLERLAAPGC